MKNVARVFGLPADDGDPEPSARVLAEAIYYTRDQAAARKGRWPDLRARAGLSQRGELPSPPFPDGDNAMVRYLIDKAALMVTERGIMEGLIWVCAHAWMEGHIAGYDAAWRDLVDTLGAAGPGNPDE